MSRIEMAMEKAARLRQEQGPGEAEASQPAAKAAHTAPPIPVRYRKVSPTNPFLVHLHDPHSPTAEEYRKLKSALVEMMQARDVFRNALLVTSSVPKEGKSLTALNLAMSLAQELDHTVLLIDADLRNPALHRYLEIEQGVGLSDVLLGKAQIGDAIIATGIGTLSFMRSGGAIDNPAELLSCAKMKALVDELKKCYPDRYLIFDTPPVLHFAETRSLAHMVDGVLFVVMERLVSQANVKDAVDSLKGCPMLGTVYNAAAVDSGDERYSTYRGDHGKKPEKIEPYVLTRAMLAEDRCPSL